ncbi:hypothetical protein HCG51_08710 [Tolypothrix sp. PCC 7910]|uniref:replication initiator protein A n=1 Tax=Tolypothrix sp. PCC 7910 TaxID=2099387 RepID=UPI001427954D|nr:replication initiator protein A [Tolypothrix sp. PCC 7910]QIR36816.1 hypothetical protein HCG51_08710 [Tolypothrix sp. PCC 7910]
MISDKDERDDEELQSIIYGRDEMNLAEFPIAMLGKRKPDQKTIIFADTVYDEAIKRPVARTLTITASDLYGLPTSLDEEVILGAVQLSSRNGFDSRELRFTRYEFLKLLNWTINDVNYKRLEESLNRWTGITLKYDKAWWDKTAQSWVSETFHIIENISIYDNETKQAFLARFPHDPSAGLSRIVWNEIIFKSFHAGNIKRLDFDFYTSLETAIAKRIFRFLDKRFYRSKWLEFELRSFATNHIGVSDAYDSTNLKVKLRPAIQELEKKGFIVPVAESQRFYSPRRGKHYIRFERATATSPTPPHASTTTAPEKGSSESVPLRIVPRPDRTPTKEELELMCDKFNLRWRPS